MRQFLLGSLLILATLFSVIPVVLAVPPATPGTVPPCVGCPLTNVSQVVSLITGIVNQMQIVFWTVAAGSGLYAAFLFIRGGSNTESLKQAKNQILYTVIAVILGVLAYGIPGIVTDFLKNVRG